MNFIDKVDNILSLFSDFWVKRDDEIKKKYYQLLNLLKRKVLRNV